MKDKHLYIFNDEMKQYSYYRAILSKIDKEKPYKLTKDMKQYIIETEDEKHIFLYRPSYGFMRGTKTHFLYVDKALKGTEVANLVLLPMLNTPHNVPAKERLKWI